jgi:hypothetical protein
MTDSNSLPHYPNPTIFSSLKSKFSQSTLPLPGLSVSLVKRSD